MAEFKKGAAVKARSSKSGKVTEGKFVAEHPAAKGVFLEVDHGDGVTKKYRPSQVTAT
ncbi:hypothetical protein GJ698_02410 [Pseudoduganella sp. FT26W]|uniref:Hypervirulence associated protein TUDOR domain-containing protein n=1 Tax=Duganella aquatilis TaxID=2666082 RepID=A0A844CRN2_9BURK|nr:hypothetical protein [Duganella aquatilis]MRW82943.1 hypothetical protein [Duganella aquatilis]